MYIPSSFNFKFYPVIGLFLFQDILSLAQLLQFVPQVTNLEEYPEHPYISDQMNLVLILLLSIAVGNQKGSDLHHSLYNRQKFDMVFYLSSFLSSAGRIPHPAPENRVTYCSLLHSPCLPPGTATPPHWKFVNPLSKKTTDRLDVVATYLVHPHV